MRLNLHELGDPEGAPLVCLHGLGGHGGRFRRLAARLEGRRVLAPDLRGHGASGWDPPWHVGSHVADVLDAVDAAGVGRADWLGVSYGGRIAATVAAAHPGRVATLALLDPALAVAPQMAEEQAALELDRDAFGSANEAVDARLDARTLFSTPRERLEEDAAEHLARGEDGRLRWRYSPLMAVTAWSEMSRPAPAAARLPTLLRTGSRSWLPVDGARLRAALGALLAERELRAGHSLLWDAEDATADAVASFLAAPFGPGR